MDQPQTNQAYDIKEQLNAMIALQMVDEDINQIKLKIASLDKQTHEEEKIAQAKKSDLDKIKAEIEKLLKDKRDAEVTSKQFQEQVSKLSGQLYDVKTNEALRVLQDEIKHKKEDNGLLEERIIEMMMAEDEMKIEVKKAEEVLKVALGKLDIAKQDSQHQIVGLEKEILVLKEKWNESTHKVNKNLLERYVKLRDARDGRALAKVEKDVCNGCRISIPPQMYIELKKYREIHACGNCARILYTED